MKISPLVVAGVLIGIGMGGFVDGILINQILQLRDLMAENISPNSAINLEASMAWDGLFHLFTWVMTALGIAVLWLVGGKRNVPWSGKVFTGGIIVGWGMFNLAEGIIDHHVLGLHHVIERLGLTVYDYIFMSSGIIFVIIGCYIIRHAKNNLKYMSNRVIL